MTAALGERERERFQALYSSAGYTCSSASEELRHTSSSASEERCPGAEDDLPTPLPTDDSWTRVSLCFPNAIISGSAAQGTLEWMEVLRNLPPVAENLDHETHDAGCTADMVEQSMPADEWAERLAGTRERIRSSRAARGTPGTLQQILEQSQAADRMFVTGAVTEACHMYDELLRRFQSSCSRKAPVAMRSELARCFKNRAACYLCTGSAADAQSDLLAAFRLSDDAHFKSKMMERLKEIRASAANQRQQVSSAAEAGVGSTSKWKKRRQKKKCDIRVAGPELVSTALLSEQSPEKGALSPGGVVTECSICLEDLESRDEDTYETPCGHAFHESCIEEWQETCEGKQFKMSCPNCRNMFSWHLFGRKSTDD
eukprot:TRINITY_DN77820_c0_g1_i1.p1 TRINITY_DN77820_c0_g1~~TRINITY_DN77820_c0_g1_i1.p1  ORF type:complete len:372 (+),score=58.48 TRINITY_DN77820_c0_g1_i1:146-1261(+)